MEEKTTILIVDDEPVGREALNGALFSQGYQLLFAENGIEALEMAAQYLPDVLLLDVMMPQMDGFEVCRRLRADPLLAEIPILLITALDDRTSRLKGLEAGADDFINKPFDRIELRARVKTITRLNRYRRLVLERARFVWVVDNDSDGYMSIDSKEIIHYANPAARAFLGMPGDEETEAQGTFLDWAKRYYECVPPEAWGEWPQPTPLGLPRYLVKPQNTQSQPVWLEVTVLVLPWGSEDKLLVRLHELSQAVSMATERWSFQTAIRHKMFTPISNILFSTGMLKTLYAKEIPAEVMETIVSIDDNARRLEGELKDVAQYIHASALASSGGCFPIKMLAEMLNQMSKELSLQPVALHIRDENSVSLSVNLSMVAMQIIFWEVLENARKFHPQLAPNMEVFLLQPTPGKMQILIRDDGVNIPPDQLARVWVPYYQAEEAFTGEVSGMGLGLATVATLVWGAGGQIHLYNREDQPGIIVDLILPLES